MPHDFTTRQFTFEAAPAEIRGCAIDGQKCPLPSEMSAAQWREAMAAVEAGTVREIAFDAIVFYDRPNANNVRPRPGNLSRLAETAPGRPWVRDHFRSSSAKSGDIAGGKAEGDALTLSMRALDQQAQARFLRQLTTEFSIGLDFETAACSICDAPVKWGLTCDHKIGEDGCEIFLDGATTNHISDVVDPAVEGTGLVPFARDNQQQGEQMPTPAEPTIDLAAKNADLARQLAEANARADKAEAEKREAAFSTAFAAACREQRCNPADEPDMRAMFAALGHDEAKLAAWFSRREPRAESPRPAPADEPRAQFAAGAQPQSGAPAVDLDFWVKRSGANPTEIAEWIRRNPAPIK